MTGLINPHTGMPVAPTRQISDEDLMKILQSMQLRVEYLNQQNMHLGLYLEFILDHLFELNDANGEPLLDIDMDKFPAFAAKRFEEIKAEAEEMNKQAAEEKRQQALTQLQQQAENIGVDLTDE